ncbi:mitochondrial porin-like protein [Pseudovirgaria hyperparasitica]|uniref:Mitochondrial porin-like protein n=1 Tax=Pseudovirgaria hyperparasitica TaxID=470096 RepID=A0A6A6WCA1_9PEZI|nr:mitochondrial porin-like protein [Pseudovirgaria hyperparasitica]KAF2759590.1 mitochondrial porin-like protein [Pseudovirgaria hyperparasitica]
MAEKLVAPAPPPPAFADIGKAANDLINRDFYHATSALLEVKLKAANGVAFTTKGTSPHSGPVSASIEGKKALSNGNDSHLSSTLHVPVVRQNSFTFDFVWSSVPDRRQKTGRAYIRSTTYRMRHKLMQSKNAGITITESFNTASLLSTKVELDNTITKGLKAEALTLLNPSKGGNAGQKVNLFFKQPNFHFRSFFDYTAAGNLSAIVDGVAGYEGFLVGGEVGYDVQKAAVSRYSAALGYNQGNFSAAVQATQNLSVFAATYYQKVNPSVEAGVKAVYDTKAASTVGIELASKYKLDPLSFAKAKINDRGIAALSYNTKVNPGFTFGVGASVDTQKLNESTHKVGASFTFEG